MSGTALANQLNLKATALYHSGDYRQAIQIWQEALQADPENQRAKEGIRMASLLLDEASSSLEAAPAEGPSESPESPETIAKVRDGIQRVREFLSAGRYLDAMEICQSLLQLAPRSEAVREVLEEAREAYEAQPFIDEHLEIARQLFVQERLDEASAELQKIFFLNSRHAEAHKLNAKIQALQQKLAPGSSTAEAPPEGFEPQPGSESFDPSQTMRMGTTEKIEEAPVLEEPTPEPAPTRAAGLEDILNEDWEAELAQLNLGPSSEKPADPGEREAEPIPLMDLSEDPSTSFASKTTAAKHQKDDAPESPEHPDLSGDLGSMPASPVVAGEAVETPMQRQAPREKARPARPVPLPRRERASLPLGKIFFGMIVAGIVAGAGWWYLGARSASESGQGSGAGAPPIRRAPIRPQKAPSQPTTEPANVGLSGNSSRVGNGAAAAGQPSGAEVPAPALTAEQTQKEIARLFDTGRSHMERGEYTEAAASFSKVLELDPANIDAKSNFDQAASRVQDQKRLQEDLQTAKEYFLEKDYESALRKFYRLPKDQHLGEIDLFIRNAWYNWAVMSMKGGNCPEALQRLDEALNSDAHDEEASKLREVADHYRDRPKDKVFYAYADRLTYRTLNQK
ncbi:MAG TPA: hypothetical protein VFW45_12170 [Candidatus Polarisedimenticolia bacterium]|nr:hypothetical protein [Candidatus Polarisedimenticolia bacterium]